jgi:hypothetical protein
MILFASKNGTENWGCKFLYNRLSEMVSKILLYLTYFQELVSVGSNGN